MSAAGVGHGPEANGDEPRWLDDGEMATWRAFIETVHDLLRALESDLSADGLTLGDYQVLVYLSEAPGPMRMSDLAVRLQLTPSGLTRRLDGLVRSGDVERVPDVTDRRVMQARLTPAGWARLADVAPRHVESVRRHFFDGLERGDLAPVARAFLTIRTRLNGDEPSAPPGAAVPERHGPRHPTSR